MIAYTKFIYEEITTNALSDEDAESIVKEYVTLNAMPNDFRNMKLVSTRLLAQKLGFTNTYIQQVLHKLPVITDKWQGVTCIDERDLEYVQNVFELKRKSDAKIEFIARIPGDQIKTLLMI